MVVVGRDAPQNLIKHDLGKTKLSLLPHNVLLHVARSFEYGAAKYGDHNWRAGTKWTRYYDAALRHMASWLQKEDNDQESDLNHLDHAIASLMMLRGQIIDNKGEDDRYEQI